MPRVFANGGMIGKTLSFTAATSYTSYGYSNVTDPIQYVGSVATSGLGNGGSISVAFTSLAGGIGGGVQTGDLVIASIGIGSSSTNYALSMSTAGYTTLYDLFSSDSNNANLGVFYKVMGATPDTSAATVSLGSSNNDAAILEVHVYRGVNTVTPLGATNSATGSNTVLANPSGITTTVTGSKVIAIGAGSHQRGSGFVYSSTELTEVYTASGDASTTDVALMVGSVIVSGGGIRVSGITVNPNVFTFSGTDSGGYAWCAATFELIPASLFVTTLMNSGVWDTGWRYGSVAS
jgi:hypothetical protein